MATRHSIIGLVEILKWMEQQGFSRESILLDTGIDDARLLNTTETLLPEQELRFYRNLLSLSDNPSILLEAGFNLKLATYGIWGLALISSPTVRKAIELGIQFVDFTYTYNAIVFFEDDQTAGIRISKKHELEDLERPMIERDISAVYVLLQHLIQKDQAIDEIFVGWDNDSQPYYESLFNCPVHFGHDATELRFTRECLDLELPQHNALALQLCMDQLEQTRPSLELGSQSARGSKAAELEAATDNAQSIGTKSTTKSGTESGTERKTKDSTDSVRRYLSSTPLYRASMEGCAQTINMSTRNLRRKLEQECASYQSILDEFRYALSEKYLNDTDMTLTDIAERLGYSDAANFSHAYKRWSGSAPRSSTR
jgi:AraC-like DNA-binding protein